MMEHLFLKLGELTFYMLVFAAGIIPLSTDSGEVGQEAKEKGAVR